MRGRHLLVVTTVGLSLGLGGCATDYSCPLPQGYGGCSSVAQVYVDTQRDTDTITPSAGTAKAHSDSTAAKTAPQNAPKTTEADAMTRVMVAAAGSMPTLQPAAPGAALLSTPRVLRIVLAPWQDSDDDLHDGGTLYLRLDRGQWTISPQP